MRRVRLLLALIAVVCIGVAVSYPVRVWMEQKQSQTDMEALSALREQNRAAEEARPEQTPETAVTPLPETEEATVPPTEEPPETAGTQTGHIRGAAIPTERAELTAATAKPAQTSGPTASEGQAGPDTTGEPSATEEPDQTIPAGTPAPDRRSHSDVLPYPEKEKLLLDEERILPELKEIYQQNRDLVGWLTIPGTVIDYPVVQSEDSEFYLTHDFYGKPNGNGQIILDTLCDPYTPSYNLVISGHRMNSGRMFGGLPQYEKRSYWEEHRIVEFDTLMERGRYVVFAAFYSADYDVDETGFRYNVDIQYRVETERWLEEIRENRLYDTGIDAAFGDEFITLTTCSRVYHPEGRFVVVCRRIREGEDFS